MALDLRRGGALVLAKAGRIWHHELLGDRVAFGTIIEVYFPLGRWEAVRYVSRPTKRHPSVTVLRLAVGGATYKVPLSPHHQARWPSNVAEAERYVPPAPTVDTAPTLTGTRQRRPPQGPRRKVTPNRAGRQDPKLRAKKRRLRQSAVPPVAPTVRYRIRWIKSHAYLYARTYVSSGGSGKPRYRDRYVGRVDDVRARVADQKELGFMAFRLDDDRASTCGQKVVDHRG